MPMVYKKQIEAPLGAFFRKNYDWKASYRLRLALFVAEVQIFHYLVDVAMTLSAISHAQLQASGEVVRVRVLEPLEINLGIRQLGSLLYGDDHDLEWDLDVLSA